MSYYLYVKFIFFKVNYSAYSTYSCIRYYEFFKLAKLLGGQNDMFAPPPPIFSLGGDCPPAPPPPRIDASALVHLSYSSNSGEARICQRGPKQGTEVTERGEGVGGGFFPSQKKTTFLAH